MHFGTRSICQLFGDVSSFQSCHNVESVRPDGTCNLFDGDIGVPTKVGNIAESRVPMKEGAVPYPAINRPPTADEMAAAYDAARNAGLWRFDERR